MTDSTDRDFNTTPAEDHGQGQVGDTGAAELTGQEEAVAASAVGGVRLDEHGLALPIDAAGTKPGEEDGQLSGDDALPPRPITEEDLADLAAVEAALNQRWPETKIDPSLERIEMLMDLLGNPERSFATIQVAGTNGKTSVVRMIESLLRAFTAARGATSHTCS